MRQPITPYGRESRSVQVDGYKRHVLHDLDMGLIRALGITPANMPEASVTEAISEDPKLQEAYLKELHIDRAYLSSHLVRIPPDHNRVKGRERSAAKRKRAGVCAGTRACLNKWHLQPTRRRHVNTHQPLLSGILFHEVPAA